MLLAACWHFSSSLYMLPQFYVAACCYPLLYMLLNVCTLHVLAACCSHCLLHVACYMVRRNAACCHHCCAINVGSTVVPANVFGIILLHNRLTLRVGACSARRVGCCVVGIPTDVGWHHRCLNVWLYHVLATCYLAPHVNSASFGYRCACLALHVACCVFQLRVPQHNAWLACSHR
jgi:hypothetical protein